MASEAVVPYIVGKLGNLLIQEAQLLIGVREGVEWIKNELEWMQCFLKDADSKQNTNVRVKKWVSDIRDVSYEIEDLIETFVDSQSRRHGLAGVVVGYISEHDVAKQIEQIKQKINGISRRRETYGISDINEGRQEASSSIGDLESRRRDSVMFEAPQLVGQDEEFRTVRDQLMTEEQRRRVISIFGIGGSGKTALAQNILKDVKDHFDCHALVYVSQQCNIKDVLVRIIKGLERERKKKSQASLSPEGIGNLDVDDLGYKLRDEYLTGKRYLVVLDDIWTTNAWDSLILKLPDDENKSRVLVTTRIRDVALHADPSGHHHEMRLLNDDESWELFMKKIFPGKDPLTACPSELKETGWKILKKCGGLPLAILVLGSLVAKRLKTPSPCSRVLESVYPHLTESPGQCMPILSLSYWDLPYYLKPCFLYLGLFPEDYEISSDILIRLWIAEGFIQSELMEDVAEGYLEELVSRSMIQVVARKSNGLVDKCCLHDLFRDLSISEATQTNFFTIYQENGTSSSSTSVRRLAFQCNVDGYETSKSSTESLRSVLYFSDSEVPLSKLLHTRPKLLRVLKTDFKDFSEVTLHEEIGVFAHLRYLEIEFSELGDLPGAVRLPPSTGELSNLQTLHVRAGVRTLPNAIFNLKQLRHLQASSSHIDGHPRLENLRNLCTLCLPFHSWMEDGLGKLTNLRELNISEGIVYSHEKTLSDSVEKLHNLQLLRLWFVNSWPTSVRFTRHLHLCEMDLSGRMADPCQADFVWF